MKRMGSLARMLAGLGLMVTTSTFAANKGSLQIMSPAMVGRTQLSAGDYTVQWDGTGPDVQVTIKKDKKVKATVPAKLVPLDRSSGQDEAVIDTSSAIRSLVEIRFSGKRYELRIQPRPEAVNASPDDRESR